MSRLTLITLLTLAIAAPAAFAQRRPDRARPDDKPAVIRTSGTATVKAEPDEARLSIGVTTQAATAEEAASKNATQVAQVIAALRKELGDAGDMRTQNYSIYPEYRHPGQAGGEPQISGYRAQNSVEVRIGDIKKVGPAIDAATASGSNQINGVSFGVKDDTAVRAQALQEAARKARANADALASGLGLKVRRILAVEEGAPAVVQPFRYQMAEMAVSAKASTPIEAGEVEVQATVTMTVEFEQPAN